MAVKKKKRPAGASLAKTPDMPDERWRELQERKGEYLEICREIEEENAFFAHVADPERLRVFFQHLGGYVYYVVLESLANGERVCTSIVHDDGIRAARDETEPAHPVHDVLCVTDLYERHAGLVTDPAGLDVGKKALRLLADDRLINPPHSPHVSRKDETEAAEASGTENRSGNGWAEIHERKDEFQYMSRAPIGHAERTGRHLRCGADHYVRKAISVADPEEVRVFIRHLGDFDYLVAAQLRTHTSRVMTSWVHQDGIRIERDAVRKRKHHPAHRILCLTDLYEQNSRPLPDDPEELGVDEQTRELLFDDDEDAPQ
jgi:hypothetical protein